ncbi:hypothetical protein [Corynebacterium cystitidis]|uniref:hypothetical protein n=1 Tax=Corynebacterium cystitidis TaxID=35757 RepID=UPI00211E8B58|nr:hypothetical protein [Corynebacterium cystitidis]
MFQLLYSFLESLFLVQSARLATRRAFLFRFPTTPVTQSISSSPRRAWDPLQGLYLAKDANVSLTPQELEKRGETGESPHRLATEAVYDAPDGNLTVDDSLVDRLVALMGEVGGWLILDRDDEFVLSLDEARNIRDSAFLL